MFRNTREYFKFLLIAMKTHSHIETPLKLRGTKYIHLSENIKLRKNYRIECIDTFAGVELHPSFSIGENVIINYNFTAFVSDSISIGKNSIFASNVMITTENHGMDPESEIPYAQQPLISSAISIGENVWLGQNVIILPGVHIGDNVIVAAGSIVTKNIDSNCICAGNPARIIKKYDNLEHKWNRIYVM